MDLSTLQTFFGMIFVFALVPWVSLLIINK